MPGYLLHQGAMVLCMHGGQAQPAAPSPRVMVNHQPVVTISSPYTVAGCTLPPPPAANGPCVICQWITTATRVRAGGMPVLLQDSQAICTPTGTGATVVMTQLRVKGI